MKRKEAYNILSQMLSEMKSDGENTFEQEQEALDTLDNLAREREEWKCNLNQVSSTLGEAKNCLDKATSLMWKGKHYEE